MAAERLPLIMEAQPEGPYRLCGYCLGGIVAFEVARLLLAAGKEVEMVFMIDPPTINARKSVQLLLSLIKGARPLLGPVVDRAKAWTWYRSADFQKFWNVSWIRQWNAIKTRLIKGAFFIRTNRVRRGDVDAERWVFAIRKFCRCSDGEIRSYDVELQSEAP